MASSLSRLKLHRQATAFIGGVTKKKRLSPRHCRVFFSQVAFGGNGGGVSNSGSTSTSHTGLTSSGAEGGGAGGGGHGGGGGGGSSFPRLFPKLHAGWWTALGIGALGYWVFGGVPPAAFDKLKVPNELLGKEKVQTIDVAYAVAQYQGNKRLEDRYEVRQTADGDVFCGVFDGHGGWSVASFSSAALSHILENELTNQTANSPQEVIMALARAFERTDRTLLHYMYFGVVMGFASFARVGACALALFIRGRDLYIANAGDCRAVLGRRRANGMYMPVQLSKDHNVRSNREEIDALRAAHPGEDDLIVCPYPEVCYIKNRSQATRTLGDAYLKCAEFNGRAGGRGAQRRYIQPPYSPPYTSATPEVLHLSLDNPNMAGAEFIVMASDGLWDMLTNQQVIDVVAQAIQDGVPEEASDRLITKCLGKAANEGRLTLQQLKTIPPGKNRRSYHDDITVLVSYIDPNGHSSTITSPTGGSSSSEPYLPTPTPPSESVAVRAIQRRSSTRHIEGPQLVRLEPNHQRSSNGLPF